MSSQYNLQVTCSICYIHGQQWKIITVIIRLGELSYVMLLDHFFLIIKDPYKYLSSSK